MLVVSAGVWQSRPWLRPLLVLAIGTGALAFATLSGYTRQPRSDPYAGLSPVERDAALRREWLRKFVATGQSFEGFPVMVFQEYPPPEVLDLDGAAREASEIVYGVVAAQRIAVDDENPSAARAVSKIRVKEALKGKVGREVELSQPGTPEKLGDQVYLVHWIVDPVVPNGSEVIVFSEERDSHSRLRSLYWTTVTFENGRARAPSRLFADIDQMDVEGVLQWIRLAVAAAEQP